MKKIKTLEKIRLSDKTIKKWRNRLLPSFMLLWDNRSRRMPFPWS